MILLKPFNIGLPLQLHSSYRIVNSSWGSQCLSYSSFSFHFYQIILCTCAILASLLILIFMLTFNVCQHFITIWRYCLPFSAVIVRGPELSVEIVSPRHDRESTWINSKQYDCLNKTNIMTAPVDMPMGIRNIP